MGKNKQRHTQTLVSVQVYHGERLELTRLSQMMVKVPTWGDPRTMTLAVFRALAATYPATWGHPKTRVTQVSPEL
jgi:hypothetical protein